MFERILKRAVQIIGVDNDSSSQYNTMEPRQRKKQNSGSSLSSIENKNINNDVPHDIVEINFHIRRYAELEESIQKLDKDIIKTRNEIETARSNGRLDRYQQGSNRDVVNVKLNRLYKEWKRTCRQCQQRQSITNNEDYSQAISFIMEGGNITTTTTTETCQLHNHQAKLCRSLHLMAIYTEQVKLVHASNQKLFQFMKQQVNQVGNEMTQLQVKYLNQLCQIQEEIQEIQDNYKTLTGREMEFKQPSEKTLISSMSNSAFNSAFLACDSSGGELNSTKEEDTTTTTVATSTTVHSETIPRQASISSVPEMYNGTPTMPIMKKGFSEMFPSPPPSFASTRSTISAYSPKSSAFCHKKARSFHVGIASKNSSGGGGKNMPSDYCCALPVPSTLDFSGAFPQPLKRRSYSNDSLTWHSSMLYAEPDEDESSFPRLERVETPPHLFEESF